MTINSECLLEYDVLVIYTCSKCGKPNSSDPSNCCIGGDFNGKKLHYNIPKVNGRYFTEYFANEENNFEGKIIRSSEVRKFFKHFIYENQSQKIMQLYQSLRKIKPIYRDGKIHNPECEYAIGDLCDCWCAEKYHGLKGVVLPDDN